MEALDLLKAGDYSSLDVEAFRCPVNQAGQDLVLADKYFVIIFAIIINNARCFVNHAAKDVGNDKGALREDVEEEGEEEDEAEQNKGLTEEEDEISFSERVEGVEDDNDGVEDDEEDCSEGGEVDNGDQEVADVGLGVDEEEQGADQQGAEVGYEELGDQDEVVDDEEQGVDHLEDEVGDEENLTEDENDQWVNEEEGGMNFELKEESLEENEQKSEEHHEYLEEHKLQETNAFEKGHMDGAEALKKKNKTNYFELDEAGPLEPENHVATITLSTSSMASTTSAYLSDQEEKKVDQEKAGFDVEAEVQCLRLDQGGNLKEKIERTDLKERDVESSPEAKKEARGPILMFNTLGKDDEDVEEITDEENEVMELEMEVEELDCALQKRIEDKNKQLDLEDDEEDVDEELEDKDRNLLYDSFEEKLQNIFSRK